MNPYEPFTDPPDPFAAHGPHGGHVRMGDPFREGAPRGKRKAASAPPPPPPRPEPAFAGAAPAGYVSVEESTARTWAILAHLSALVANVIGPLVVWLVMRKRYDKAAEAGREALNFQVSLWIYGLIAALFSVILIGIPFLIVLPILSLVMPIVAAIRTSSGEDYRYPLSLRII